MALPSSRRDGRRYYLQFRLGKLGSALYGPNYARVGTGPYWFKRDHPTIEKGVILIHGLIDSLQPTGSDWTNEDCAMAWTHKRAAKCRPARAAGRLPHLSGVKRTSGLSDPWRYLQDQEMF